MLKKAPRLKSTIKTRAKGNINVRPASEAMIELMTLLFLNSLAEEAKTKAFEEKAVTIRAQHVRAVSKCPNSGEIRLPGRAKKNIGEKVLKKARG